MENVTIIGTGPAGLTAALYTARAGLRPLVIEGMQPGGQLAATTTVENYPGFPKGIGGAELVLKMREQAERFGARHEMEEVTEVDFGARPLKVKLSGGRAIETRAAIIATGASANYLGLPSERKLIGCGVSACATCDGAFYRDLPVAVIGGGDTAMEESLFLANLVSKVTVIHRRNEFRASKIMGERVKSNPKIEIRWDTVVEEVLDVKKNEVTCIRLRNVKTGQASELAVSGVFVAVGHTPNSGPFKGHVALDEKGFIVTDHTRTDVEGVCAAGDVQDPRYKQAVTAAGSGCMAALEAERYLNTH
ncbi:MAG: thioredoxin-disulfide reductase [Verrucomicrobiota bacterium]|nr:thioredoxin-disulfide reductase [Verrucomicrobiota bacterium]